MVEGKQKYLNLLLIQLAFVTIRKVFKVSCRRMPDIPIILGDLLLITTKSGND